jgi:hypothetical protein
VARCDATRYHEKSRDSRNAPVIETHSTEHLPKRVVLDDWEVQQMNVPFGNCFHYATVDKILIMGCFMKHSG